MIYILKKPQTLKRNLQYLKLSNLMVVSCHLKQNSTPGQPKLAYELIRHPFKYSNIPQVCQQNQINLEKNTVFYCKKRSAVTPFLYYSQIYSTHYPISSPSAKPFYCKYVEIVTRWVLCEFLYFGKLSSTEKGTN